MNRLALTTTLLCTLPTLIACSIEETEDTTLDGFRSVVIADHWGILEPASLPELDSCSEYWAQRCDELSPAQCTMAQNRYVCTEAGGVVVTDNFGELTESIEWDGYSADTDGLRTGDSATKVCDGMNPETCATLAKVADLLAEQSELWTEWPTGGIASLTIRDGVFVVSPLEEPGEDLTFALAEALDWRVPTLAHEFSFGKANGLVLHEPVVITVRPNGTIAISDFQVALMQRMKQPFEPPHSALVTYSMSASGANYNHSGMEISWERYAAQWKAYIDTQVGSVDLAQCYNANSLPLLGAENQLNYNEAHLFTNTSGSLYDPVGTWMSEDIDDPMTGFAFAAMVMHYWHSPVFFTGAWEPSVQQAPAGSWFGEIALERLTFDVPTAPDLHSACGISPNAPAVQALAAIQSCDLTGVTLDGAVVTVWEGLFSTGPTMLHHAPITGTELVAAYLAGLSLPPGYHVQYPNGWSGGRVGELIFDPPAEASEEEIAAVRALADVLADELREQVTLDELVERKR
jgi:hypothetical protein